MSGGGRTMGTTWHLETRAPFNAALIGEVQRQLDAWEAILSHWQADSAITRFNESPSTAWTAVPPELVEVVELSQQIGADTDHALDVTLAPLIELWGFGAAGGRGSPPPGDMIEKTRARCGWQHLHTRQHPPALRKDRPGLRINVSAVAEGWALDRLAAYLESQGLREFLLEIGGEVVARGEWRVGIQHPAAPPGQPAQTLRLKDQCLATSGVYRQHFIQGGQEYSHVLDPRTGRPVAHALASVSVIHDKAAQADGLATALLVLGPQQGRQLAEERGLRVVWFERASASQQPISTAR